MKVMKSHLLQYLLHIFNISANAKSRRSEFLVMHYCSFLTKSAFYSNKQWGVSINFCFWLRKDRHHCSLGSHEQMGSSNQLCLSWLLEEESINSIDYEFNFQLEIRGPYLLAGQIITETGIDRWMDGLMYGQGWTGRKIYRWTNRWLLDRQLVFWLADGWMGGCLYGWMEDEWMNYIRSAWLVKQHRWGHIDGWINEWLWIKGFMTWGLIIRWMTKMDGQKGWMVKWMEDSRMHGCLVGWLLWVIVWIGRWVDGWMARERDHWMDKRQLVRLLVG